MSKTVSKLDETIQDLIGTAAEIGVHGNPRSREIHSSGLATSLYGLCNIAKIRVGTQFRSLGRTEAGSPLKP
jgi:hypothetical protein